MGDDEQDPRVCEAAPLLSDTEENASRWPVYSWWAELTLISRYSVPLVATYLLQYSFSVITTFTAGHLGQDDLAAASVGVTTMNIAGLAIFEGMATALDTLCAHAYGAGNKAGVGLYVQRMLLLMAVVSIPVGALWICSPAILSIFLKQEYLAVKAGSFLRVSLIGLPGWLFAFHFGLGLDGAALEAALANSLRPILLFLCILFKKSSHKCWPGPSRRAFKGWGPMLGLSAAGSAVTLAEWAAFEILTFSTSYLSTTHLAAQTILTTTSVVMWHIPFSFSVGVSTRIGHLIGAGLVTAARQVTILYAIIFVAIGLFDAAFLFSLRNYIGLIFSTDPSIHHLVSNTMFAVAAFQIVDATIGGCNGILRGLAKQSFAAWVVFFINHVSAVPLAIWLELGPWRMGLDGVWIGLGSGLAVIAIIEVSYMIGIDWRGSIEYAKSRED
ncbi:ethionine resistance [Fusarium albosuccineum]|uniref:Ethionine resistance n=1 Tax=Fusarium albosuccineum TaxID=1237068 RepID=A0A8H4P387_9HYPO|nr:ethionine resistance [Fusarium albosuccineum]